MADKVLSANRSDLGHSFLNAMWIAGFLATIQIVAVAMAVIKRSPSPDQPLVVENPPAAVTIPEDMVVMETPPATPEVVEPKAPPQQEVLLNTVPIPDAPPPAKPDPSTKVRQWPAPDLSDIDDPVSEIGDSLIAILIDSGIADRKRGKLQSSLDAFLEADSNVPDHPRILSEIAATYAEMGKLSLSDEYWTRVSSKGEIVSGPYYKFAQKALRGEDPSTPDIDDGKYLKVGKPKVKKQPIGADGEWVTLEIPIVSKAGETISGSAMDLRVYFFDLINGVTPGQTTATITYDFPSKPYNWQENRTEEVEVIYHQPLFTVEQKQNLGERVYFGYVIELYYRNQLQDSVVSSDALRSLRFPASEPVEEVPPPQGPDTSLFPINR